jgi:hypothetical protein
MLIYVKGGVRVEDIIGAFKLPEDLNAKLTQILHNEGHADGDRIDFDDVEVEEDVAYGELNIDDEDRDIFRDNFDESDVIDLAQAIRMGNRGEAELLLDRMFRQDPLITEWIQRGRYSGLARRAA